MTTPAADSRVPLLLVVVRGPEVDRRDTHDPPGIPGRNPPEPDLGPRRHWYRWSRKNDHSSTLRRVGLTSVGDSKGAGGRRDRRRVKPEAARSTHPSRPTHPYQESHQNPAPSVTPIHRRRVERSEHPQPLGARPSSPGQDPYRPPPPVPDHFHRSLGSGCRLLVGLRTSSVGQGEVGREVLSCLNFSSFYCDNHFSFYSTLLLSFLFFLDLRRIRTTDPPVWF